MQDDPATPAGLTDAGVQEYCSDYKQDYARLWVDMFPAVDHRFLKLAGANGGGRQSRLVLPEWQAHESESSSGILFLNEFSLSSKVGGGAPE